MEYLKKFQVLGNMKFYVSHHDNYKTVNMDENIQRKTKNVQVLVRLFLSHHCVFLIVLRLKQFIERYDLLRYGLNPPGAQFIIELQEDNTRVHRKITEALRPHMIRVD